MNIEEMQYEEARELKKSLGDLLQSPGWEFVEYFLAQRSDIRHKQLLEMCPENTEQMVRFARMKGGIDELRMLPEIFKQVLSDIEEYLNTVQENEDGES